MRRPRGAVMLVVLVSACLASCGRSSDEPLTIFAASSLSDVFGEIVAEFEAAHPDVEIAVSAAGSSALVAQLADGAPADVVATADVETMTRVPQELLVGEPVVFAHNSMAIAVEPGNPLDVTSVADLARVPVLVLADERVPAGSYARDVLTCAGVDVAPASLEQNVGAVASKVALGEADAAIVYRTDIGADLEAVEIGPACNVRADYPIVATSGHPAAQQFVDFVTGPRGAAALASAGFELP